MKQIPKPENPNELWCGGCEKAKRLHWHVSTYCPISVRLSLSGLCKVVFRFSSIVTAGSPGLYERLADLDVEVILARPNVNGVPKRPNVQGSREGLAGFDELVEVNPNQRRDVGHGASREFKRLAVQDDPSRWVNRPKVVVQ